MDRDGARGLAQDMKQRQTIWTLSQHFLLRYTKIDGSSQPKISRLDSERQGGGSTAVGGRLGGRDSASGPRDRGVGNECRCPPAGCGPGPDVALERGNRIDWQRDGPANRGSA
ncbi:hypothetical protein SBA4_3770010 [Candidatus Sulfopaludibacter sp. SbA4]|nr:hypothetical protein SBA4_3770010 [Candidatus Sulfopaludibacter sp. SbA4]